MKTIFKQFPFHRLLRPGRFILPFAVVLCANSAFSQTAPAPEEELPSGPLPAPVPEFSQWTVSYSYAWLDKKKSDQGGQAQAPVISEHMAEMPRTITITKSKDIVHEQTVSVGGTPSEDWQVRGACYIKYPGNDFWSAYEKTGHADSDKTVATMILPPSGFRNLDWIKKEEFVGTVKLSTGKYLVFVPGGRKTVNLSIPGKDAILDTLPQVAYIDAVTHLPYMVRADDETRTFQFNPNSPNSIQVLPDDLAAEIKQGDKIRAARNAAPMKEY